MMSNVSLQSCLCDVGCFSHGEFIFCLKYNISNFDILFPPGKIISLENVAVTRAHFILPLLIQNK